MSKEQKDKRFYLSFEGPFNMRIISSSGRYFIENLSDAYETRISLYRVFIEICQNVALYSAERFRQSNNNTLGIGRFVVEEKEDGYVCSTSNAIQTEHREKLSKYCEDLNKSNTDELINLKSTLRHQSSLVATGAHIGLISIKLYSKNQLKYDFLKSSDDDISFNISAFISKS